MREILAQANFDEMISQEKTVLSFYHDWSQYSAIYGIQYFKEADNYFLNQKNNPKLTFWIANVSDVNSSANFLHNWIENNSTEFNLVGWIAAGNPSIVWLRFGRILNCEFSSYILKNEGIINKTIDYFDL